MNLRDEDYLETEEFAGRSSTVGRLLRLIRKELSEILRDRRTILTLVLMPLLLYPLLSIAFQQFLLASAPSAGENKEAVRMGFLNEADQKSFADQLGTIAWLPPEQRKKLPESKDLLGAIKPDLHQLKDMLFDREIDVIIVPVSKEKKIGNSLLREWDIYYLEESYRSKKTFHQLGEWLAIITAGQLVEQPRPSLFLWATGKPLALPKQDEDSPLKPMIPLILILMTITGAVYPAIDLTAGERERGTLEILVAAPVPRLGLLFAKYVTVVTIAILTALVNLVSMTLTVWVSGMGKQLFGDAGLPPLLVLEIFGLLLLFAAFFSAVLLTLTSFARSFKEAQAYLIPLMLVALAPGVAGLIPGVKLSPTLCLVPLLNIVLLSHDLFKNTADPLLTAVVISSTLVYAVGAIAVAARLFGSEDVLYSNQSSWAELFRRPINPRPAASVSNALLCLCVLFSLFFLLQGVIRQLVPADPARPESLLPHLILIPVLSVALFVGLPLVSALVRRVQIGTGFLLRSASILAFVGALLLGLSLWPLVLELLALFQNNGWTTISQENRERIVQPMRQLRQNLPLWVLLVITVVPALTEELFFRGFLFAALQRVCSGPATIIICAVLFGLFHVATESFGLERLLPSTLMGLVLGWVCWRSGSVIPAMLLHACHNAILACIGYALAQQAQQGTAAAEMSLLPLPWLFGGATGVLAGAAILFFTKRPASVPLPQEIDEDAEAD